MLRKTFVCCIAVESAVVFISKKDNLFSLTLEVFKYCQCELKKIPLSFVTLDKTRKRDKRVPAMQ